MIIEQLELPGMNSNWGGARKGAGRKAEIVAVRGGVRRRHTTHAPRVGIRAEHPLFLTMRLAGGLPSLREPLLRHRIRAVFQEVIDAGWLRIVVFSIQSNHLHLVCEADDRRAFVKGNQSLKIRLALMLNPNVADPLPESAQSGP